MKKIRSIKSKVTGAVKFFFMGDAEPLNTMPSSAAKLFDIQLDMVTGGTSAANTNIAFESTTENKKGGTSDGWGSSASGSW